MKLNNIDQQNDENKISETTKLANRIKTKNWTLMSLCKSKKRGNKCGIASTIMACLIDDISMEPLTDEISHLISFFFNKYLLSLITQYETICFLQQAKRV